MSASSPYYITMTKTQVHIVFKESVLSCSGNEFIGVFFDRTSAEVFIAERPNSSRYFIETYEAPESGMAHEVFA
jgi:hypothetical protein